MVLPYRPVPVTGTGAGAGTGTGTEPVRNRRFQNRPHFPFDVREVGHGPSHYTAPVQEGIQAIIVAVGRTVHTVCARRRRVATRGSERRTAAAARRLA